MNERAIQRLVNLGHLAMALREDARAGMDLAIAHPSAPQWLREPTRRGLEQVDRSHLPPQVPSHEVVRYCMRIRLGALPN